MDFNKPRKKKESKDEEQKNKKFTEQRFELNIDFLSEEGLNNEFFEQFTSMIEIPYFPDEFFQHVGDKEITDDEINLWIEECVCFLEEEPDEQFASAQSGDTKLIVLRVQEGEKYHYLIEVFRDRYTIQIAPEEL